MTVESRSDYGVRTFDLSEPRTLQRVDLRADSFAVLRADDSADIRINAKRNATIDAREISSITIPPKEGQEFGIERLYLSNSAGTGKLKLLTGFGGTAGSTDPPSGDEVDVTNREAREIGKVRMQDAAGVLVDPATDGADVPDKREITSYTAGTLPAEVTSYAGGTLPVGGTGPHHDRVTTAGSYATINPGTDGDPVQIVADTSGAATLTVEVSNNGADWSAYDVSVGGSQGTAESVSGFAYVRAQLDSNINSLELSAKGI